MTPTNKKSGAGLTVLIVLLVLADLGLLVWIGASYLKQREPAESGTLSVSPDDATGDLAGSGTSGSGSSAFDTSGPGTTGSGATGSGTTGSGTTGPGMTGSGNSGSGGTDNPVPSPGEAEQGPEPQHDPEPEAQHEPEPGPSAAERYSTSERPSTEDFAQWYAHYSSEGIPGGARTIGDFDEITGSWKGLFRYGNEEVSSELMNFIISGTANDTLFTVDWYLIAYAGAGEWMNEEDMDDTTWEGSFSGGTLAVSGAGTVTINMFYEYDGQQYAVGELMLPNGMQAVVGMIRP